MKKIKIKKRENLGRKVKELRKEGVLPAVLWTKN
jgi:ribosomal protein L25 (general stress protein Ctc)